MDLREIAEQLGYSDASGAYRAIEAALRAVLPEQTRDEFRRLEVARIDALQEAAWPLAMTGDPKAANTVLRCIALRSKLLGLEAPVEVASWAAPVERVAFEQEDLLTTEFVEAASTVRDAIMRQTIERSGCDAAAVATERSC